MLNNSTVIFIRRLLRDVLLWHQYTVCNITAQSYNKQINLSQQETTEIYPAPADPGTLIPLPNVVQNIYMKKTKKTEKMNTHPARASYLALS